MLTLRWFSRFLPIYLVVFGCCIMAAVFSSRTITAIAESTPLAGRTCIIIDAGHGGEDGGAISCTGVYESTINLQIALRLDDLLHFLGYHTKMTRTEDVSLHTQGNTIAAHKASDLNNRTVFVNTMDTALLVSIHQNSFSERQYSGAQVFYAGHPTAKVLAEAMQTKLVRELSPNSKRTAKQAKGIYLMEHIVHPGILVECGFLSNPEEEAKLRSEEYQKLLCCIVSSVLAQNLSS